MKIRHTVSLLLVAVVGLFFWLMPSEEAGLELTDWQKQMQADHEAYAKYSDYVHEVCQKFAKEMSDELGLIGYGNSRRKHGKLEKIELNFDAKRRATIEEARALYLYVMDKFVKAVNAHEKLKPFLIEYPFTYKRISMAIYFKNSDGRSADGSIAYISNNTDLHGKDHIFYSSFDPFKDKFIDLPEESHEEAVERACASTLKNPLFHQTTPLEEAIDEVLPAFAEEMWDKYQFVCSSIGGKMGEKVEDIGARFTVVQRAEQEEARKILIRTTKRLLQVLNSNEKLRPYLAAYPFPIERLRIRICFTRRNHFPYHDGSMESVTLDGGKVTYYQEIPYPVDLYPPETPVFAEETFAEALRAVEVI